MARQFTYSPIFTIQVFHNYFLNKGQTSFEDLNENEKAEMLAKYDFSSFLNVIPTPKTKQLIKNHRLVLRKNNFELHLIGQLNHDNIPLIEISADTTLEFYLVLRDIEFLNYTSLDWKRDHFLMITNHPLWDYLPHMEFIKSSIINENHAIPRDILVHNLVDQSPLPSQCIGVISLKAKTPLADMSIIEDEFKVKENLTYKIQFQNRATIWKYILKSGESLTTSQSLPLTKTGYIPLTTTELNGMEDYDCYFPNPSNTKIAIEGNQAYSEIFINN
ncbi:hypothetical protein ACFOUP_07785 [Belliella kenyensis]|uniref:Ig-like domain-containing protein n=1 Tax=Belliella kenyensis TaxID=1472724 RepID=A0ABV8EIZ2_9BACT|nr:hypothetical protein [Belliella kenyensis]MCH7400375.1 hypothetical protein [Belliella kenyensis]MDN3604607.1 hypothetical protein [Belliella kenyensis]